jgi:cell division septation protein DedD
MIIKKLCAPALLYLVFSLTQIIIDIFKNMYNTAFFKFIVMILFTLGLNILCQRGLGIISWFIVFIPFIMMTVITTLLLFVFGLSPSEGNLDYSVDYPKGNPSPAPVNPSPVPVNPSPVPVNPVVPVPVVPTPVEPTPVPATPVPVKPSPSSITPSLLNPVPDVPSAPFQVM